VTSERTEEVSQSIEWLTPFPFDGLQPVYVEDDNSQWHVVPHWALVDGRAMLVGLDIRCFIQEYDREGNPLPRSPVADRLADLTQHVLRGISLSAVRTQSQTHLARRFTSVAGACPSTPLGDRLEALAAALTAKGQPRKRRAPAQDDLLARVAQLYELALSSGSTTPVRYVEERLRQQGIEISTRGGRDQVRKWVQRARQRGLLAPPPER
jgi:AraC-like DNA-binding protein